MSLPDIEKNDVDISKLFSYKREVTLLIPGTTDEITFYQRVVGDADNNKARVYALRESGKLRENLRNSKWEDRVAYLPDTTKFLKDDIINHILGILIQELSLEAINEVNLPAPKEPAGDASLEEQEKYQEEIDKYPDKFNVEVAKVLEQKLSSKRKELEKHTKDTLRLMFEGDIINKHCQEKFAETYIAYSTFFGTFVDKDHKKRAFKTFEDFENAPTNLKEALMESYSSLQISSTTLKKSQGVTP